MPADFPSGTGGPVLPELTEALLDGSLLRQYFEDLSRCAAVERVVPKWMAQEQVATGGGWGLGEAREWLEARRVRGVQIHYHYDGSLWCDTLLVAPAGGGVRIVRMRVGV